MVIVPFDCDDVVAYVEMAGSNMTTEEADKWLDDNGDDLAEVMIKAGARYIIEKIKREEN